MTEFTLFADTLDRVAATSKRNQKIKLAAEFLRKVDVNEVHQAALFMGGRIFAESDQRVLNVSWKGLLSALNSVIGIGNGDITRVYDGDVGEAIAKLMSERGHTRQTTLFSDSLTIKTVGEAASRIAETRGRGSSKERQSLLASLFVDASPREAKHLAALFLGDMRTGLSEGLLAESIAVAFDVDAELVRRAWSFSGDLGYVAEIACRGGAKLVRKIKVEVMRAIKPMLASPVDTIEEAFALNPEYSFEMKLDGARVQIHKDGSGVKIFSRRLSDVTESLPDIVQITLKEVNANRAILDGEVLAIDKSGKPFPFQVVMTRFGRTREVESAYRDTKLKLVLFDILLLDDHHLVDNQYSRRRKALEESVSADLIIERLLSQDVENVKDYFDRSRELGHEGLVAKVPDSPYYPGVRGKHWLKIKHTLDTMDLVIIAAEWGHGRRSKWLSDYHLAVRDDESGKFKMIGKTYKGFTDKEFQKMTEDLQALKVSTRGHVVYVKPQIVVEVIASEIQESPTYESGLALRFARISRIREDKGPEDAMTLKELRALFEHQFRFKAR
ncbi:MAG: ATP-dependent DNA ligase [Promethearchaeota archaeon]